MQTGQTAQAHVDVNCYRPVVSKSADPSYTLTATWAITKSVSPSHIDLFEGDSAAATYNVTATRTGAISSTWMVTGKITVENPAPMPFTLTSLADKLNNQYAGSLQNCTLPVTVPARSGATNGAVTCDYQIDLSQTGAVNGANQATATVDVNNFTYSGSAPVDFAKAAVTGVNVPVGVTDAFDGGPATALEPSKISDTHTFIYSRDVACAGDLNYIDGVANRRYANTATIVETGQSSDANFDVTCYKLSVSKTADPSYTQPYTWTLAKTVDQSQATILPGQTWTPTYSITVTRTALDPTDLLVTGQIVITNPAPIPASLAGVADILNDTTLPAGNVVCRDAGNNVVTVAGYSLAAGATLTCDYQYAPPALIFGGQNLAIVTMNNNAPERTTAYLATAPVDFGNPNVKITKVLNKVNVTDQVTGQSPEQWVVSQDQLTDAYTVPFTCSLDEFTTNNTSTQIKTNQLRIVETGQQVSIPVTRICNVGRLIIEKATVPVLLPSLGSTPRTARPSACPMARAMTAARSCPASTPSPKPQRPAGV